MPNDEWFRNRSWDEQTELRFNDKLRRARDKSQYLRIQASYLSESLPEVALTLLDRYFELGEHLDWAQALVDQARALLAQERVEDAISSLKKALDREREHPNLKTEAWSIFARLVSERSLNSYYEDVLHALAGIDRNRLLFPLDRFNWHAAQALIDQDQGRLNEAQSEAREALAAANEYHSGFQHHPKLGLVAEADQDLRNRLGRILDRADQVKAHAVTN